MTTIVDMARERASSHGDELVYRFLITGDVDGPCEEWSYTHLDTRARAVAVALAEHRALGERALLLFAPGLDFVAAFMGCLYAGAIAVPSYPPDPSRLARTLPRLRAIARDCQPRIVLDRKSVV